MFRIIAIALLLATVAVPFASAEEWTPLFNGKDLTGWEADNPAKFKVEDGVLIGFQEDGKGANIYTEKEYDNFELRFTYKVKWPANSGLWFRTRYQFDILKHKRPKTFSGAFYYPGCKGTFAWVNLDEGLEDQTGWNDAQVYANGNTVAFWLNGKMLGEKTLEDGKDKIIPKGKIGLQVHGGNQFKGMQIALKSIEIRMLKGGDKPTPPKAKK
jgi:hypothetical protein